MRSIRERVKDLCCCGHPHPQPTPPHPRRSTNASWLFVLQLEICSCKTLYTYVYCVFVWRLEHDECKRQLRHVISLVCQLFGSHRRFQAPLPVPTVSCYNEPLFIQTRVNCSLATATAEPPCGMYLYDRHHVDCQWRRWREHQTTRWPTN
jgi:hypothetical protein